MPDFMYLLSENVTTGYIFSENVTYRADIGLYTSLPALKRDLVATVSARYGDYEDADERIPRLIREIESITNDDVCVDSVAEVADYEVSIVKVVE